MKVNGKNVMIFLMTCILTGHFISNHCQLVCIYLIALNIYCLNNLVLSIQNSICYISIFEFIGNCKKLNI